MVSITDKGVLIKEDANTTVGTDGGAGNTAFESPVFRDALRGSHRTVIYGYTSVAIAAGGVTLKVKDPSGTFRTFLALKSMSADEMSYFIADGPLGEARVDVVPNVTKATSKNIYVWFISQ